MDFIILSKSAIPVIGWIAQLLGLVMNGIYEVLDALNIPNIGLAIILFTIIIYLAMTPLQIHQQKMSKVMAIVTPEMTAIQKKYQGKKDALSQQKMNEETMALYEKYGTSPTGSCLPLAIQMPIILALYQVILRIPAYITRIGNVFAPLAAKIYAMDGSTKILTQFLKDNKIRTISLAKNVTEEKIIDFLYALKPSQWSSFMNLDAFSSLRPEIASVAAKSQKASSFLFINISNSPLDAIRNGISNISSGNVSMWVIGGLIVGLMVPILAWFTQWLTVKLMPQQNMGGDNSAMGNSMKSMNLIMPLFSAFMCLTLSMGIGIYWIMGAVIRSIQQVVINRRIADMDPEELIEKAKVKNEKKRKSSKNYVENVNTAARLNTRKVDRKETVGKNIQDVDYYKNVKDASVNSITAKANMVRLYDEKKEAEKRSGSHHRKG